MLIMDGTINKYHSLDLQNRLENLCNDLVSMCSNFNKIVSSYVFTYDSGNYSLLHV